MRSSSLLACGCKPSLGNSCSQQRFKREDVDTRNALLRLTPVKRCLKRFETPDMGSRFSGVYLPTPATMLSVVSQSFRYRLIELPTQFALCGISIGVDYNRYAGFSLAISVE